MVRHVTLTPDVVYTLTLPQSYDYVAVFHHGNVTADVWAALDEITPAANGDDSYLVPSGARRELTERTTAGIVKLLSTQAAVVEVEYA